jgi:hypothetical protein
MTNLSIQLKVKNRLNKLASMDYDNIECWQIVEAFNKAQIEWVRRQLHGSNSLREGDEQSKMRVDDLQVLLTDSKISGNEKDGFVEYDLPDDYLSFKRVQISGKNECCPERSFKVYQVEEANVNIILSDANTQPNFEWAETICTLINNKVRVYTSDEFSIVNPRLIYYRFPRSISIKNCSDPSTGLISTKEVETELKDDVVELIIDDTVAILAGDIENILQSQRSSTQAERNN